MSDSSVPIPANGVYLLEAFNQIFRAMTPHWKQLEDDLERYSEERVGPFEIIDAEHLKANLWLRARIQEGSITAFIRDPMTGNPLRLSRDGWEDAGLMQGGIESNFVGPDDMLNPGPTAEINGVQYPVFFDRDEFQSLVRTHFGEPELGKRVGRTGRPPLHDWEEGRLFGERLLKERGDPTKPENTADGWRSGADLAREIMKHMADHAGGIEPPISTAKEVAYRLLDNGRK
jgi:hypothetical protein